jgi:hypothetical protein
VTGAANVRLHHDPARGALHMIATAPIPAGAEVVNCYGRLSNSDLLRGYGYVERSNSNEHAQVPAQFLLRAAAGALAKRAGRGGSRGPGHGPGGNDGGGGKEVEKEEEKEEEEAGGEEDGEIYDVSEGSESEESEPDYDLEDDEPPEAAAGEAAEGGVAAAAAATPALPRLAEAMEAVEGWEDRWALAHALRLLPKGGAFSVYADGGDGSDGGGAPQLRPHAGMAATAALLLAGVAQCKRLFDLAQHAGRGGGGGCDEHHQHGDGCDKHKGGSGGCGGDKCGGGGGGDVGEADAAAAVAGVATLKVWVRGRQQGLGPGRCLPPVAEELCPHAVSRPGAPPALIAGQHP